MRDAARRATATSAQPNAIEVRGISKAYGKVQALDDVSLDVAAGTIHGLLGPNGAGKTTLVRILTTLLRPDDGRAWVAGFDVEREATQLRSRIGLAGQSAAVDEYLTDARTSSSLAGSITWAGRERRGAPRSCSTALGWSKRPTAAPRPTPAVCGVGWTWRRAWWPILKCSCSTSRPAASIRALVASCGAVIRQLVSDGTTVLLTTQYLEEADELADRITVVDMGAGDRRGHGAGAQATHSR